MKKIFTLLLITSLFFLCGCDILSNLSDSNSINNNEKKENESEENESEEKGSTIIRDEKDINVDSIKKIMANTLNQDDIKYTIECFINDKISESPKLEHFPNSIKQNTFLKNNYLKIVYESTKNEKKSNYEGYLYLTNDDIINYNYNSNNNLYDLHHSPRPETFKGDITNESGKVTLSSLFNANIMNSVASTESSTFFDLLANRLDGYTVNDMVVSIPDFNETCTIDAYKNIYNIPYEINNFNYLLNYKNTKLEIDGSYVKKISFDFEEIIYYEYIVNETKQIYSSNLFFNYIYTFEQIGKVVMDDLCTINFISGTKTLTTKAIKKGDKITSTKNIIDYYQVEGFYLDKELTIEFDYSKPINTDINIYVKGDYNSTSSV